MTGTLTLAAVLVAVVVALGLIALQLLPVLQQAFTLPL
jgi:hypothetical protein